MTMYPQFQEALGPDGMKVFNKYVFFPKFLQDPSMIDALFPQSVDELKAESENESLKDDKMPPVAETDNHQQHILVHMMAKKTWATWNHIGWHQALLAMQQKQQQAEQPQPGQDQQQKPDDKSKGKDKKPQSNMQATAPSMGQQAQQPQLPATAKTM